MIDGAKLQAAYALEISAYGKARARGDATTAWHHLERSHILGQRRFGLHLDSHRHMLDHAIHLRQPGEVLGQLMRLILAPIGNLTGRLPIGNTGRSDVSAFVPMDVPEDLQAVVNALPPAK